MSPAFFCIQKRQVRNVADVIDDLKIQIEASTQGADAKLDRFIDKLGKLQMSIFGLEMSGVGNIASGINQISMSVRSFNERTKTADFTRVATGLNKLSEVNVQGLSDAARALSSFVGNVSGMGKIDFDSKKLTDIANSVSKLGRVSVTDATQNLEFLKTSLAEFISGMNSVGTLTFNPKSLTDLVGSVSKLGGVNATQSVKNLPNITTYLKDFVTGMNGIGSVTFNAEGLTKLVNNISRLGGVKATQAATNLKPIKDQILRFVSGLNGIGALNFDTANLTNLVSSITKLGGKAAGNSIGNIQQLGVALKGMMQTLSTAPAVSQNLIQMTNALAALASNGNRVSSASNAMYRGLNLYSSGAKKAQISSHGLASAIGRVYATYWVLFRAFRVFGKSIGIASDLVEVQNVIDVSFGNMSAMVDKFTSNSIQKFGMSELAAKKMSGVFMAMGRSLGGSQSEMANMSIGLTKLAADMSSFYNVSQEDVGEDLRSIFTGMVRPLRDYGIDLTQATLQEYAHSKGIRTKVANMTQLEKVQLRYNYVMEQTAGIQGDYERTAGTWANQVRLLTQQFQQLGSIVGGTLINAFKPFLTAMNAVISKVIAVAKAISDALGKIFGWTFEASGGGAGTAGIVGDLEDAAGAADDLGGGAGGAADKLGDAADNAKRLAGNLQAFDKLNVITSPSNSGGSGGSGGGAGGGSGAGDYGEWVKGESILDHFKSDIDNLYELGEYIGRKLTEAMNDIDWESAYQGARDFGKGLADFLNGLISPSLFGATGRTIAGALNTAIYAALSFGENFAWKNFGLSIATGINEFFSTFDFASAGITVNTFANGILDAIIIALENANWVLMGQKIGEFFAEIEWETLLTKVGKVIIDAISASVSLYAGMIQVAPLEASILAGITAFKFVGAGAAIAKALGTSLARGVSLKEILVNIGSFTLIGGSLPALDVLGNEIITKVENFISENFGVEVTKAMGDGLLVAVSAGIGTIIGGPVGTFVGAIIGTILDAFTSQDSIGAKLGATIFNFDATKKFFEEAKASFTKAFNADRFGEIGYWILEGILDGFIGAITFIIEPFVDFFDAVIGALCDVFGINSPAENMKPYGEYILLGIVEGFRNTFGEWTKTLIEWKTKYIAPWFTSQKWTNLYNVIKTAMKTKWNETVGQWATDISSWWGGNVSPWFTASKWLGLYETIKTSLKEKWDNATSQWKTDISNWWNNDVLAWFSADKWTSGLSGVKTGFENAFNAAFEGVKEIWNRFAKWLNEKLTFDIDPISIMGKEVFGGATINLGKVPTFATGGFPEDGLFMANHNELVGEFSNGKSVVANNEQITSGIAMAVRSANSEMISELRRQNELLQIIANKPVIDKGDVVDAWKAGAKDFRKQTGRQLGIIY